MDQLFTLSTGVKRKEGIPWPKLLELASRNKLPAHAFLQSEGGNGDWVDVGTLALAGEESASESLLRHCLECDARLQVSQERLSTLKVCPGCAIRSKFVDFLAEDIAPIPNVPREPWGKFDVMVFVFATIAAFVAICGAVALMVNPPLAVLLGFIMLAVASGLFAVSWQHRSEAARYRSHLRNTEDVLEKRTTLLSSRSARLAALERGLAKIRDDIAEATSAECQKHIDATQYYLQVAKESAGAIDRIAGRYLDEQRKWWTQKLKGDNFHLQKGRIEKAIVFAEKNGYPVPGKMKKEVFGQLELDYKLVLRKEAEQARQRQIREKIRIEQKAEREVREAAKRAEEEQRLIQEALDEAMAAAGAEHSAEVEELQLRLKEAEERGVRAISQAQLTKVGYVYIISNLGAFGEGVFKVGLTRRLEPLDRVKELGDASVPFVPVYRAISSGVVPAVLVSSLQSHSKGSRWFFRAVRMMDGSVC